jgi:subtilisin family serine protease
MKTLIINIVLTLSSYVACFAQMNEALYYYAFNDKIFLNEVKDKVLICVNPKSSDIITRLEDLKVERFNDSTFVLTFEESRKDVLTKELERNNDIIHIQPVYTDKDGIELFATDEVVLRFKDGTSTQEIEAVNKEQGSKLKRKAGLYQIISVPKGKTALEVANRFQISGLVKYSHPNFIAEVQKHSTIPNDPYFYNQFYLRNTGQTMANGHSGTNGADIRATDVWDFTKGSSSIIIAVVDEGVTSNHPDLPNTRQVRLNGSNFADSSNPNDPSPAGDDNHGNSCAGVIAATHNNEGIAGIAPNCKIMPIRIPYGNYPGSLYADAITFAKNNGADIISNSWGYNTDNPNYLPVIVDAIEDATLYGRTGNKGCVVTFSAGNTAEHASGYNGTVNFPSNVNVSGVLTVGASDRYDQQADYSPTSNLNSTYNQVIDVVAPSHRAYSCSMPAETFECWTIDIPGTAGYNTWKNSGSCYAALSGTTFPSSGTNYQAYTGYFGGTSCACPEVSGVAALVLSVNSSLTQQQVSDIIQSTARKAGGYTYQTTTGIPNGTWNTQMGHGVIDASAAVLSASCVNSYTNQIVTSNTTVVGCNDLTVQNVTVSNNAKLTLEAPGTVTINGTFEIQSGASLDVNQ